MLAWAPLLISAAFIVTSDGMANVRVSPPTECYSRLCNGEVPPVQSLTVQQTPIADAATEDDRSKTSSLDPSSRKQRRLQPAL